MGSWAEVSVSQSVHPSGDSNCPGADTASGAIGGSIHLHPLSPGAGAGPARSERSGAERGWQDEPRASHGSHGPGRAGPGPGSLQDPALALPHNPLY